jgi:NADPH:quinone reductase-like Zn-dependent oxidoreductase
VSLSVRIHQFGGPEVLKIEDVVVPNPGPHEVRLRVKAIGLNRTEVTFRTGASSVKPNLPTQIGWEAAGAIDAVGPDVKDFIAGDRVAVIPAYGAGDYGFYGELALAPARSLVRVPSHITWEEAAASWAAFATAWTGLIDVAALSAGQVVLVPAASSSVGLAAMQIARRVGAIPVALTRTSAKAAALRDKGAAHVVATQEQDLLAEVTRVTDGKGAEVVFDPVAGPGFARLVEAVATGGTLVVYGAFGGATATFPVMRLLGRRLSIRGFGLPSTTRDDAKLAVLKTFIGKGLAAGDFKPAIAKVFRFDEIADAHRYLEAGEQIGKIVVTV